MMSMNHQSVNVTRVNLLSKLKENLETHVKDYQEAMVGFQIKLVEDLHAALVKAKTIHPLRAHELKSVAYNCPRSYEAEYREIIDMMEASVDEVINLDANSFKAYFKNEWSWSSGFNSSTTMYKAHANR